MTIRFYRVWVRRGLPHNRFLPHHHLHKLPKGSLGGEGGLAYFVQPNWKVDPSGTL